MWPSRTDWTEATAGVSASRVSFQNDAEACGSRSNTATRLPSRSAATARAVCASVRSRIAAEPEPAAGILRGDGGEDGRQLAVELVERAGLSGAEQGLHLGPARLDR